MSKPFRILSLDGGGLRGIIPVLILQEIEKRSGKKILDLFDLIAGTSTGGLIACGLTVSNDGINPLYNLKQIEEVYTLRGKDIFPKKVVFGKLFNSLSSLKNPRYSDKGIDLVLTELFATKRISDCIKPIFITSLDLYNNEALFFKSRQAIANPNKNALLKDVCRATSAAPTYLPAYKFIFDNETKVCIDGGVYANNPTIAAIVEIIKYYTEPPYSRNSGELNNIHVLSLSTGHYTSNIGRSRVEGWGLLDWVTNITDVMMQAVNQTTTYQSQELIPKQNFMRLNIDIANERYTDMADSSDKTRAYLIEQLHIQILSNKLLMKQLDDFIVKISNS